MTTKLLQDEKGFFFFFFLHGYEITFDGHADNQIQNAPDKT